MSQPRWPVVRLGEVLRLDLDRVNIDPAQTYDMVGVYSFGRGLFRKERLLGVNTSYKYFFRLRRDHVVMSRLFAWEGALALSSPEYEGAFVSPQFPTFLCDETRLDRRFLGWLMRRPSFWEELGLRTKGMGNRRRTVSPEVFLNLLIPLPSLEKQRRIVEYIEKMTSKIKEAHCLRQENIRAVFFFVTGLHLHLSLTHSRTIRLNEILVLDERREEIRSGGEYPQLGLKGFGQGFIIKGALDSTQTTYKTFNRLYEGTVVLSQVKGWEGAIAVCPDHLAGRYVSPEYRTFRCIGVVTEYFAALVATPWFWTKLKDATRGVGARRERTRPEDFLRIEIPMPTIDQQRQALHVLQRIDKLKHLQIEMVPEIEALLPSVFNRIFHEETLSYAFEMEDR